MRTSSSPTQCLAGFQSGWLYQNLVDADAVVAIDVEKRAITGRWSLAPCEGPSGMAIDTKQRRLFSVCSKNATLVVFDLDTHRIVASLKIGGGPDSVAFDPTLHRIYSAGKAGELTVVHQDGPIPTGYWTGFTLTMERTRLPSIRSRIRSLWLMPVYLWRRELQCSLPKYEAPSSFRVWHLWFGRPDRLRRLLRPTSCK